MLLMRTTCGVLISKGRAFLPEARLFGTIFPYPDSAESERPPNQTALRFPNLKARESPQQKGECWEARQAA